MESFVKALNELSFMLNEKYPENSSIEFGSLGFEEAIQEAIDGSAHERHTGVIIDRIGEEYGMSFLIDFSMNKEIRGYRL